MPIRTWTGSLSGSWAVAGNWEAAVVPIAGDVVIIPRTVTQDITSGLDQAGIDLETLHIVEDSRVNIGQPGARLSIGANLLIHSGRGTLRFETGDAGIHVDQMVIDSDNKVLAADLYKTGLGLVPRLLVVKGRVSCGDITKTGRIETDYRHNTMGDAHIECKPDFTSEVALYVNGGSFSGSPSLLTTVQQSDGVVRIAGSTNVTTWNIHNGQGYFNSSGNITTAHVMGGVLDLSENDHSVTITHLYVYRDGEVILPENVSVTNRYPMRGIRKVGY